jgi:hypothetical protein
MAMYSFFPTKTIRRYLINNKLNYNFYIFQLVLLFCFKTHALFYGKIMEKCLSANHSPPFHGKWCLPYNKRQ